MICPKCEAVMQVEEWENGILWNACPVCRYMIEIPNYGENEFNDYDGQIGTIGLSDPPDLGKQS